MAHPRTRIQVGEQHIDIDTSHLPDTLMESADPAHRLRHMGIWTSRHKHE